MVNERFLTRAEGLLWPALLEAWQLKNAPVKAADMVLTWPLGLA